MARGRRLGLLLVSLGVACAIDWATGYHGAAPLVLLVLWVGCVETELMTRWLRNSDEPAADAAPDPWVCPECGYALEGLPGEVLKCPECGVDRPRGAAVLSRR